MGARIQMRPNERWAASYWPFADGRKAPRNELLSNRAGLRREARRGMLHLVRHATPRVAFRSREAPLEYHVRTARLTDVEPAIRILLQDGSSDDEAWRDDSDRLRSLLYVPSSTVVVAEAERRVIGLGVLSIRPSVRSGPFIGAIDELAVESTKGTGSAAAGKADAARHREIGCSIIEHLVKSARNKGCTRVEVTDHLASAEPTLLKQAGFAKRGVLLSRAIG